MKSNPVLPTVCLITALAFGTASGAEQDAIVIDDLTVPQLRSEIEKIQTEFYRVFNNLNEGDEFDIVCHSYTPTGSNISERACEPQFMIRRRGQNAKDYQDGTDELLSPAALVDEMQAELQQLTERMNSAMRENEYFRELNRVLQMLRGRLAELTG